MKIYTKTGDEGQTGLFAGGRADKDDPRIEACGSVDELNAALGVARALELPSEVNDVLEAIQHTLFEIGAELATPEPAQHGTQMLSPAEVEQLEQWIDTWDSLLSPLTQFILPAGSPSVAALHLARAVCRRAERRIVTLRKTASISDTVLIYLNRLGDLLFVASRYVTHLCGHADVAWRKRDQKS